MNIINKFFCSYTTFQKSRYAGFFYIHVSLDHTDEKEDLKEVSEHILKFW